MLNLDETCVLEGKGTTKIFGSSKRLKHKNNREDYQESITIARTGSAGGSSWPCIFLGKGFKMDRPTLKYLPKRGAPPGSVVIMTANAYTTEEAWRVQAPYLCKGIQEMEVIRDHPDWWLKMTLDGFASHIDVKTLEFFTGYKIVVCKE